MNYSMMSFSVVWEYVLLHFFYLGFHHRHRSVSCTDYFVEYYEDYQIYYWQKHDSDSDDDAPSKLMSIVGNHHFYYSRLEMVVVSCFSN